MTEFITNCILNKPFKIETTDKSAFTEKLVLAYLYRLEKRTIDLVKHLQKVYRINRGIQTKMVS